VSAQHAARDCGERPPEGGDGKQCEYDDKGLHAASVHPR
jgi:hypothetical protein